MYILTPDCKDPFVSFIPTCRNQYSFDEYNVLANEKVLF